MLPNFGSLAGMELDKKAVGRRLRAAKNEVGFRSTQAFAEYVGQKRGTVDAWLNGRALPPVHNLQRLHHEHGITLDWLFFNDASTMQHARLIRLEAALARIAVPPAEPDVPPAELVEAAPAKVSPRPGKKKKAAT